MLWLATQPQVSGLFNLGTGRARSFLDLMQATAAALRKPVNIEFTDMPESMRAKYQYFTRASMQTLQLAGYDQSFFTLEDGVRDYVKQYLIQDDIYR
jgi:ADP-L-glycero-D-manno-heptose 6-epimerase